MEHEQTERLIVALEKLVAQGEAEKGGVIVNPVEIRRIVDKEIMRVLSEVLDEQPRTERVVLEGDLDVGKRVFQNHQANGARDTIVLEINMGDLSETGREAVNEWIKGLPASFTMSWR